MTMTRPTTEQITHETRLLSDVLSGIVTPEAFGAKGDGVTNDTAALQAALDTLKEVRGSPGKTYLVRRVSGTRRCLLWKSGMRWFGCGSVIKLADGEYVKTVGCSVIMSEGTDQSPSTVTTNTSFIGTVDGNEQNQDAIDAPSGLQFTPTMYMNRVATSHFDLNVINALWFAFYCVGSVGQIYDNTMTVRAVNNRGGGVLLDGTRWSIDSAYVKDTKTTINANATGNPFIASITDSMIGRLYCDNHGFGIKFQNGCSNVSIDSIVAVSGANTTGITNTTGVKFQSDTTTNTNINVGSITSTGWGRHGLYIYNTDRITIGSYMGENNGIDTSSGVGERSDTRIIFSDDVTINSMTIRNCAVHAVGIDADATNINIGHATFLDTPNAVSLFRLDAGTTSDLGSLAIQSIGVRNEAAGWAAPVISPTAGDTNVIIGPISIDVPFANYTAASMRIFTESGATGRIRTGPVMFRGSPTSQTVELTPNSTTTAVPSAAVMVDSAGIALAPIIKVEPVSFNGNNQSAGYMRGRFSVSVGNQSTGGLTIRHPPSPPSPTVTYARWTLEGYQAPGDCLEATSANSLIVMSNATAAQIADKTNSVNLGGKHTGQLMWDTTNNRLLRSSGTTDVSPWHVVDGSATVTPS